MAADAQQLNHNQDGERGHWAPKQAYLLCAHEDGATCGAREEANRREGRRSG